MNKIIVIGKGNVGRNFIKILSDLGQQQLVGIFGRGVGLMNLNGLAPEVLGLISEQKFDWCNDSRIEKNTNWDDIYNFGHRIGRPILVDLSTEANSVEHRRWRERGWPVATANKKPIASTQDIFDTLVGSAGNYNQSYKYETTCGAGLPVISTLQDLIKSGDKILSLTAAVSGTLGFLFSQTELGRSFAEAVGEAMALGYTEADPREDLSGQDIARKALILARTMGLKIELSDLKVENLVPTHLAKVDKNQAKLALIGHKFEIDERLKELQSQHKTLRYLIKIESGKVSAGLIEVPENSIFGSLRGPENMFVIKTERYFDQPLIIRGPGAGGLVTAAGVVADLQKLNLSYSYEQNI